VTVLVLVNLILPAFGREVTLYWEPSPSPDVIGYKVYYQQGTPQLPLRGTEADQGISPIDAENSLMASVSGLEETAVYYFSVTAYDSHNNESTYSNIVSTAWMPPLLSPQKESIVVPWNVTFDWDAGPPEHYLNYTLYYGTDKNMVINAGATPGNPINIPNITWPAPTDGLLIVIALMLMLTLFSATDQRDRRAVGLRRAAIAGFFVFSLVACSDGGGSGWSGEAVPLSSSTALTSVNTGNITSYQTDNLLAGTTYYWKVDALSTTDPGTVFHSETYSFTTE
jgi:hypothetical protein